MSGAAFGAVLTIAAVIALWLAYSAGVENGRIS
jgi:hypothetical protein